MQIFTKFIIHIIIFILFNFLIKKWHSLTRKQKIYIYIYLIYFLNVAMKPGVYIYIYIIFN